MLDANFKMLITYHEQLIETYNRQQINYGKYRDAWKSLINGMEKISLYSVSYDSQDLNINLVGTKHDLEAFWGYLRKSGFEFKGERPAANAPSFSGKFIRASDDCSVYLFFTSSVCRQVKVGTKLVEQPVYETVCGETLPPSSTPLPTEEDDIPF